MQELGQGVKTLSFFRIQKKLRFDFTTLAFFKSDDRLKNIFNIELKYKDETIFCKSMGLIFLIKG